MCCIGLGAIDDSACINVIRGGGNSLVQSLFAFLSDESTGKINTLDLNKTDFQYNPNLVLSSIDNTLQPAQTQATSSAFDIATRANIVVSVLEGSGSTLNNPNQFANVPQIIKSASGAQRESQLTARLLNQTGQTFTLAQVIGVSQSDLNSIPSSSEILNITNQIANLLQQRQQAIQSFVKALQNTEESLQPSQDGGGSNQSLLPSLNGLPQIPQIFESMIEDETYDDYGPGSGNRFVLKNRDIISWQLDEVRPSMTTVEVVGRYGDNVIPNDQLPNDLNVFQGGGNALTTTAAVDYDMWRMYGLCKQTGAVQAPFLTNPETQCPVYAVSLLNQVRHQVFSGSITIIGNEYQQPGEVVYIENLDKLFYVESVTHNFTYGTNFNTAIAVSMGHSPGEFIPTPLDVIGKILYKNKDITQYTHKKQADVFNQQYLGTIAGNFAGISQQTQPSSDLLNGPYGEANRATIAKIISAGTASLSTATGNFQPQLEIRVFFNSNKAYSFSSASSYATSLANSLKSYLTSSS